ncbi:type I-E CRISPR-associated protein Cas6/Cse3/CasE [Mycobacterium hubeiense]|uniref:type I-E CRISPR-associated protein Cas6/Cse3/CasE n=1 Tax=Mycobacterium hubeiense TaxID=1867256 RepID=UPI000C7F54DE|nr:type I-E CRISPR-associated protein Cas6/Cse3/CasE [Mycobacterium sp. QGD 101]
MTAATMQSSAAESLSVLTTIITLDVEHAATRAILTDAHQAHKLTMSGFAHLLPQYDFFTGIRGGHSDHRRALNILYATHGRPDGTLLIRLQSDAPPCFSNTECDWWRDAIHPDYPPATKHWKIPGDGQIAYQIRATPHVRVNGKLRTLTTIDKQSEWWHKQAANAGLQLHGEPAIDQPITLEFPSKHHSDPNKPQFRLPTLRFTGTATITDPHAYRHRVTRGIGRGLPYGAGMLLTTTKK